MSQLFHTSLACRFTHPWQNIKLSHWMKPDMFKLWYLRRDLCDMLSTVCWKRTNKFFKRWSAYSCSWNKTDKRNSNNQMALSRQHTVFHDILNKPPTYDSLNCYFCRRTQRCPLNICEDKWLNKLSPQISTQSTTALGWNNSCDPLRHSMIVFLSWLHFLLYM